ncbi:adenylate/guanylate cyclase domain-containing protein [Aquiflexum sp.]|uniref:adenylate/guanylate cyclase domain-containing protein n=1 Tax=Aquiflexum sp. TaxID=1872584 RepID=UPI0035932F1C
MTLKIGIFNQFLEWIDRLGEKYGADPDEQRKTVILIRACFVAGIFMLLYMGQCIFIEFNVGVNVLPFEAIIFFLLPLLLKIGFRPKTVAHLYILNGTVFGIFLVIFSGGLYSPVTPWLTLMPICGILFINPRSAWIWAVLILVVVLGMGAYSFFVGQFPKQYNLEYENLFFVNCYAGLIFIYLLLSLIFENKLTSAYKKLEKQNQELAEEKAKSDGLLLNILPLEIADELKAEGESKARQYEHVTVLFTDFVNFTGISEKLSPQDLVAFIHKNFTAFDDITEKYGLEKIKTIGDAYLAVCGLPVENLNHAQLVIKAALEIREYMENNDSGFKIRIGVHTGQVVAGIVGVKKYAYDIWGDTVNTAARMEQNSEEGRINISGATYDLVKGEFDCTYRGKISAKNKGEIDMYFVNG